MTKMVTSNTRNSTQRVGTLREVHIDRVRRELHQAGVTSYGLMKGESHYLPQLIHDDEHIGGVVYGQYQGTSAMLIATDHRVIFLDHKPLFTTSDELTYDAVSGVRLDRGGIFSTVTLHTRIAEYTIRYVNGNCARQFVRYIEAQRLEKNVQPTPEVPTINSLSTMHFLNDVAQRFLKEHDTAVLSTLDRTGNVSGTVIYYLVDQLNRIYLLTKSGTVKARNILVHDQVALTVFDADRTQTLTIQGRAELETDQTTKDYVFTEIVKPRLYGDKMQLPPVTKLSEGAYTVIRVTVTSAKYTDYGQMALSC